MSAARQPALADKTEIWGLLWGGAFFPSPVETRQKAGRAAGTFEPHTRWLRSVILEMRRTGHGCADTWRRLRLVEDPGTDDLSFIVSDATADDVWDEIGGDIRGKLITWECFRSAWRRAGNGSGDL